MGLRSGNLYVIKYENTTKIIKHLVYNGYKVMTFDLLLGLYGNNLPMSDRYIIGIKDIFECFMIFFNYRLAEY